MLRPMDDATWDGSYQQRPRKPSGDYFKTEYHFEYDELPPGLLYAGTYCDPNLAKKSKGDNTCIGAISYSPDTMLWYVIRPRYKSFSGSNELIDAQMELWNWLHVKRLTTIFQGMDGNVSQESHWSQHIENYAALNNCIVPFIEYKHYNVEMIAKNAQTAWESGRIRFPAVWHSAEEKKRFEDDFFAFTGRKLPGIKDDAPDWFCCIMQAMMEIGVGMHAGAQMSASSSHGRTGFRNPFGKKR